MTDRLSLYNGALQLIDERKLASLTENREPRRKLDDAWNGGAVRYCLEQGLWNFATRSVMIDYDSDFTAPFGFRNRFTKPDDYVRTAAICSDEYFTSSVTSYSDERRAIFCDLETLYVQFVSDDAAYGNDLSNWPETFTQYVESYLAFKISPKGMRDDLKKEMKRRLIDARSKDAMEQPVKFPPRGGWANSRLGARGAFRDPKERR